jgi:hypothetical protein
MSTARVDTAAYGAVPVDPVALGPGSPGQHDRAGVLATPWYAPSAPC